MNDKYYRIYTGHDGEIFIFEYENGEALLKDLHDDLEDVEDSRYMPTFLGSIPNYDPQYWKTGSSLIIKGEIVLPTPETIVKRFKIK